MTTLDTASGSNTVPSDGAKTKVIKVFLLDGKTVQENRDWMSVVRFTESHELRLFLHDAKGYRAVSQAMALSLLSKLEQRSLLAILKRKNCNSGGGLAVSENCIRREPLDHGEDEPHVNEADREDEESSEYLATEYGNHLESDEIFCAGRPTGISMPLFKDHGNTLVTNSNSAGVAESLVRIAHARGWTAIRVYGSEAFRHAVWLEASARGIRVKGYIPTSPVKTGRGGQPSAPGELHKRKKPVALMPYGERPAKTGLANIEESKPKIFKVKAQPKAEISQVHQSKILGAKIITTPVDVATFTAYEQAVVMARMYENLSHGFEIDGFLPLQLNRISASESAIMEEFIADEV